MITQETDQCQWYFFDYFLVSVFTHISDLTLSALSQDCHLQADHATLRQVSLAVTLMTPT